MFRSMMRTLAIGAPFPAVICQRAECRLSPHPRNLQRPAPPFTILARKRRRWVFSAYRMLIGHHHSTITSRFLDCRSANPTSDENSHSLRTIRLALLPKMTAQDGEWNQVSRKRGRLRNVPAPKLKEKAEAAAAAAESLGVRPNPSPDFTLDDILRYHDTVRQEWENSDCWRTLSETISNALSTENRPVIAKAICLGPGPYDPSNGSAAARRTAHMQTAAFRSIVDTLESKSKQKIKCIIQEPAFTPVDLEFCTHQGLEVAESPAAFSMVDENTLLFGIHIELPTYHEALLTLPGIFIGVGLGEWDSLGDFDKTHRSLLGPFIQMDSTYDKFDFPDLNYIFFGTTIYWRKEEQSPNEEAPGSESKTLGIQAPS